MENKNPSCRYCLGNLEPDTEWIPPGIQRYYFFCGACLSRTPHGSSRESATFLANHPAPARVPPEAQTSYVNPPFYASAPQQKVEDFYGLAGSGSFDFLKNEDEQATESKPADPLREVPAWWPECPYPEDVFPMTTEEIKAVIPADRITGVSGYYGRMFWNIAAKSIFDPWKFDRDFGEQSKLLEAAKAVVEWYDAHWTSAAVSKPIEALREAMGTETP